MIPSRQEIAYRVYGALRLARFDVGGVQYFDFSPSAALRSFFAAALVAPAFAIMSLLTLSEAAAGQAPLAVFLVYLASYSLNWTVFPVVAYRICQVIDREEAFFRYLSADNWAGVVGFHIALVVVLANAAGVFPGTLAVLLELAVHSYLLILSWFIARHCLDVSTAAAVGLVALQFFIALFIHLLVASILG